MSRPPGPPLPDRWVFFGVLALLAWLPWPWGSHTPAAKAFFCLCAALLVALDFIVLGRHPRTFKPLPAAARFSLILWAAWLAWIALQLLPLPAGLLGALSPGAFEVHAAAQGLPGAPARFTLSILPGETADQLLLSFGYFCLFWLVLNTARGNRRRQRLLLLTLLGAGVGQAVFAIVTAFAGMHAPGTSAADYDVATGSFINRNHLAGYLELTMTAGLALVLADLRPKQWQGWRRWLAGVVELAMSRRLRIRAMVVVMVIAMVLTQSRMGNVAFFAALALCGSGYMLVRHKALFLRSLLLFLSVFVIDLAIVSERYGLEKVAHRLEATDLESEQRVQVLEELRPVVGRYALTGAGLGTFGAAYSPYRTDRVRGYYDHAHNDHVEFIIETGFVGYGLLALMAVVLVVHGVATVFRRNDPRACALGFVGPMALSCLAVHGLADFNLHIPAVAGTLVALWALCLSGRSTPSGDRPRRAEDRGADAGDTEPLDGAQST